MSGGRRRGRGDVRSGYRLYGFDSFYSRGSLNSLYGRYSRIFLFGFFDFGIFCGRGLRGLITIGDRLVLGLAVFPFFCLFLIFFFFFFVGMRGRVRLPDWNTGPSGVGANVPICFTLTGFPLARRAEMAANNSRRKESAMLSEVPVIEASAEAICDNGIVVFIFAR